MKIILDINNKSAFPISGKLLKKIVSKTIEKSGSHFLGKKNINLSLAFLTAGEIKKINKCYRKKNSSTDVLSFANYRSKKALIKEKSKSIYLGELLFDYEYIKKSAKVNRVSTNIELTYVISHGILHLLGMKHSQKMFTLQDRIVIELK
jgi:probable rRNA maturation factor